MFITTFPVGFCSLRDHFQSFWTPFEPRARIPTAEFVYKSRTTYIRIRALNQRRIQIWYTIMAISQIQQSADLAERVCVVGHGNWPTLDRIQNFRQLPWFSSICCIFHSSWFLYTSTHGINSILDWKSQNQSICYKQVLW